VAILSVIYVYSPPPPFVQCLPLLHSYAVLALALAGVSSVWSVEVVGSLRRSYDSGVVVNDDKQSQLKVSGYAPPSSFEEKKRSKVDKARGYEHYEEGNGYCVDARGKYYAALMWSNIASVEDCKTYCISVNDNLPTDWPFRGIDYNESESDSSCFCLFDTIDDEEGMRTNIPKCTDLNPSMDGCFVWDDGSAGYGAVESIVSVPDGPYGSYTCVPWSDESEILDARE
jgi:hypothetical protein